MTAKQKDIITVSATYIWVLIATYGAVWANVNLRPGFSGGFLHAFNIAKWVPVALATIFFMRRDKESLADIGFAKGNISRQILSGILAAIGSLLIFIVSPAIFGINLSYVGSLNIWSILLSFVYMMLTAALIEEIIFRGHLFKKLLDVSGSKWFAILLSSILFGFFHIIIGNILQVIITAMIALYWCLCRDKIKHCTLLSLIIAHALHNTLHPVVTALFFAG